MTSPNLGTALGGLEFIQKNATQPCLCAMPLSHANVHAPEETDGEPHCEGLAQHPLDIPKKF